MNSTNKFQKKINIILFQTLYVLSLILGAELFCRGYYLFKSDIPFSAPSLENLDAIYDSSHPYLPVVLRRNNRLSRTKGIFINNVGFRGPDVSVPKKAGTIRIAALGGSTVWGAGMDDDETWPRVLESNLRRLFPEKTIEVINAGVPGYNSMESLINLITKVLPLKPDILLIYDGYNDMKAVSRGVTFEPDYSDWRTRENPHHSLKEKLINISRLLFTLDRISQKIPHRQSSRIPTQAFKDRGQVESFRRNIFNMVALCKAHKIIPVLSTFNLSLDVKPLYKQTSIELAESEYGIMLKAYNQTISDIAEKEDVILVDIEKKLPDDETVHTDMCHFTVDANRKVGGFFSEKTATIIQELSAAKTAQN